MSGTVCRGTSPTTDRRHRDESPVPTGPGSGHLSRRWGTIDLTSDDALVLSMGKGRASSPRSGSYSPQPSSKSQASTKVATATPFKSILKHSRSSESCGGVRSRHGNKDGSPTSTPRKAISFSQDVIFCRLVEQNVNSNIVV